MSKIICTVKVEGVIDTRDYAFKVAKETLNKYMHKTVDKFVDKNVSTSKYDVIIAYMLSMIANDDHKTIKVKDEEMEVIIKANIVASELIREINTESKTDREISEFLGEIVDEEVEDGYPPLFG